MNYLQRIVNQETLSREETHAFMLDITREAVDPIVISAVLAGIQMRGITPDELLGFRDGLLETGLSVDLSDYSPIDIVGTGGDGKNTFNISTCSAFVLAGAGYKVAKHGNGSATSTSGASNVLQQHGVKFTNCADRLRRSIEESGVAYLHAPLFALSMKYVAPIRRVLQVPTCFNLLGPIINPARPSYQLLGVANLSQMRLYGHALRKLGMHFCIVNSTDGYDEISLTGSFKTLGPDQEGIYTPQMLGLPSVRPEALSCGGSLESAAAIFDNVLEGTARPEQIAVVAANAAFAIRTLCPEKSISDCLEEARVSIESERARQAFHNFVMLNQ